MEKTSSKTRPTPFWEQPKAQIEPPKKCELFEFMKEKLSNHGIGDETFVTYNTLYELEEAFDDLDNNSATVYCNSVIRGFSQDEQKVLPSDLEDVSFTDEMRHIIVEIANTIHEQNELSSIIERQMEKLKNCVETECENRDQKGVYKLIKDYEKKIRDAFKEVRDSESKKARQREDAVLGQPHFKRLRKEIINNCKKIE